jgi:hypothetical protein
MGVRATVTASLHGMFTFGHRRRFSNFTRFINSRTRILNVGRRRIHAVKSARRGSSTTSSFLDTDPITIAALSTDDRSLL